MTEEVILSALEHRAPFYTLSEAREELSLNPAKFRHAIESGRLNPVVYSKKQKFLRFNVITLKNNWVGHGTADYRGHLNIPGALIQLLLDGESVSIGAQPCFLIEESGLSNLTTNNPFTAPLPIPPITSWEKDVYANEDEINGKVYDYAVPMPKLSKGVAGNIYDQLTLNKNIQSSEFLDQAFPDAKNAKLRLIFRQEIDFTPSDLRISQNEISNFYAEGESEPSKVRPSLQKSRNNLLHELVHRIIDSYPRINAQGVMDVLKEESEKDDRLFDIEYILHKVDARCVEWESLTSGTHTAQRKTIQNIVSNYKRKDT